MLDDYPEFAPVIGLIDVSSDIEALRAELTEIFSRVYLANAHNVLATIVFIYGVTSLAALGGMVPYIRETTALAALSYAWQPGCAPYASFSDQGHDRETEPGEQNVETLIDRALANGDERDQIYRGLPAPGRAGPVADLSCGCRPSPRHNAAPLTGSARSSVVTRRNCRPPKIIGRVRQLFPDAGGRVRCGIPPTPRGRLR